MKIAVYSGSFNPLHIGHLAILRRLSRTFDKVMLIVSPKNPLKESASESDATQRLKAATEAVGRHPELLGKVVVSDIEFKLPAPNYTICTLDALKSANPHDDFSLVVGGDQIADFRRWKDYRRILCDYSLTAFPREGFNIEAIREDLLSENQGYHIELINMPLVTISSTEIRKAIAKGDETNKMLM